VLEDRVCIVTGGASGLGRATALEMARQGARVAVADVQRDAGGEVVELIRGSGGDAAFFRCDMRVPGDIRDLMTAVADRFGGIDVLHNNAGIVEQSLTTEARVDTLPEDVWNAVYEVNLRGVWLATKWAAPHLKKAPGGAIVNAASVGGLVAGPASPAYCATKGAVIQLTKATAIDLAPFGVRCNCYAPSTIETQMVRHFLEAGEDSHTWINSQVAAQLVRRPGTPEDVAKLVCFLASDDAKFINGATYQIDGGLLAWRGFASDPATHEP
jgi:NAD(P)-dependent dehydrogenase (short-subunit alcohol dehydrogenase family)